MSTNLLIAAIYLIPAAIVSSIAWMLAALIFKSRTGSGAHHVDDKHHYHSHHHH